MTVERWLGGIAGAIILASIALAMKVNPWWYALTAFVGLSLLQSAFTDWCPMMWLLRKLGARTVADGRVATNV